MTPKEKKKAYDAERYKKNKEAILARNKEWSENNRERHRALCREWNAANSERKALTDRRWVESHREECSTSAMKWAKNNPIAAGQIRRRSDRKRKGLLLTGVVTQKEWDDLLDATGHRCLACGRIGVKLEQDHIIPLSKGGLNVISNIQPLCKSCNCSKGTKVIDYRGS